MIEIINLSKKYGNNAILENVSCSLENQRIYALVGVNGIGKSTLLNAVTQPANLDRRTAERWMRNARNFKCWCPIYPIR